MPSLAQLLFDQNPLPALIVDAESLTVGEANPAAQRLFHFAPHELQDRTLRDLCAPDAFARLNAALAGGSGRTLALDLLCAEGMPFPATVQAEPLQEKAKGRWLLLVRDGASGHGHGHAPAPRRKAVRKAALVTEGRLREALEKREFVVHYQPKYELGSGRLAGAEALVRWLHPEQGLIPPDAFIPLAEETQLILPLGEWVLNEACRQARRWEDRGLKISANLSAIQLHAASLTKTVDQALRASGVRPGSMELEITETAAMRNPGHSLAVLRALVQRGLSISLDDFGKGYSSLNYLKQFPVDTIKIDLSFIRDVLSEPKDAAIVRAIIILGHNLGMKVLAEGVEIEAEAAFLRSKHCDLAQGYLYSRPVPVEAFELSFLAG